MPVSTNVLNRQPSNLDFARTTQFRFSILKIPNTEYHITEANLPGIAFGGDAILNTRYTSMPFMGDTLDYSPLELSFMVQEDLSNWREIHDWMSGIGFPKDTKQYADAISDGNEEKNIVSRSKLANPAVLTSDATLTILTNKNNPIIQVDFRNIYPTSLSGLAFNTQDTDSTPLTAQVTMSYDIYEIRTL
jgi:hypothetical protein